MSVVRCHMTMTLDGYVTGLNQGPDKPFGEGTEHLNDWMWKIKSVNDLFGKAGGETGPSDDVFRERMANVGAYVMGRNMFGGSGPWGAKPWNGWWGDDPPYHTPVFVLTHFPREPLKMQGGTTFYFVTEGIESAIEQAKAAAGAKDVSIGGGAKVIQQALRADLVDQVELHLVPQILGAGGKLFDGLTGQDVQLELDRTVPGSGVTHLRYRVVHR